MSSKKIVIAIDGPAASGKSTTAKLVAERLGYLHIDTGAMYRAVTLLALEQGVDPKNEEEVCKLAEECEVVLEQVNGISKVLLNGRDVTTDVRTPNVTRNVSLVSSYARVREAMVREQRRMASNGGVVLDGRDIGTVVLTDADLKVFMVANVSERARRRKKDLALAGVDVAEDELVREIEERDRKDSTRNVAPLKKAMDAIEIDTTGLTVEQQVDVIVKRAEEIIAGKK